MNLLFVCTGNTCRSPAAEALARAEAARRGLAGVRCASAGIFAFPGQPAAGVSVLVARERGLDLGEHRSRELDLELVEWADLILGMTPSHAAGVSGLVPDAEVRLLTEFLPDDDPNRGRGIADPVGGDRDTYERTYAELEAAIQALFDRLAADGPLEPDAPHGA
jgi:protein-tyrosine-phosphatase